MFHLHFMLSIPAAPGPVRYLVMLIPTSGRNVATSGLYGETEWLQLQLRSNFDQRLRNSVWSSEIFFHYSLLSLEAFQL